MPPSLPLSVSATRAVALCAAHSPPRLASAIRPAATRGAALAAAVRSRNRLAAIYAQPSLPLSASTIYSAALYAPRLSPLLRRPFVVGLCAPPLLTLGSAMSTTLAAAFGVGHSLGRALRAVLAAAFGVGCSFGSALNAALVAALGVSHQLDCAMHGQDEPTRLRLAVRPCEEVLTVVIDGEGPYEGRGECCPSLLSPPAGFHGLDVEEVLHGPDEPTRLRLAVRPCEEVLTVVIDGEGGRG